MARLRLRSWLPAALVFGLIAVLIFLKESRAPRRVRVTPSPEVRGAAALPNEPPAASSPRTERRRFVLTKPLPSRLADDEEQPRAGSAELGYDEAADWETMATDERVKIGLTPAGLYSTAQAGAWDFVGLVLQNRGYEAEAKRALELASRARTDIDVAKDFPQAIVADERKLHADIKKVALADPVFAEIAGEYVDLLGQRSLDMAEGRPPNVEDKIAREREEALSGQGRRRDEPKENDDKAKEAALIAREAAEANQPPPDAGAADGGVAGP